MEALLPRFRAAHTQVLGVSVDSIYSHANWGASLGGVSFPLLSDFQPKGAVAASYGVYLGQPGITDRATVIIDKDGIFRHATSVTPSGRRDPSELAGLCESVDREHGGGLPEPVGPEGLPAGAELYVKSACGFCRAVLLVRDNLHLAERLPVRNITDDGAARTALARLAGKEQVPALVRDGEALHESKEIIRYLVDRTTDLPG